MRTLLAFITFTYFLIGQEIVLKKDGEYKILSNIHLVNEIPYKKDGYQALIEIPSGSTAKWEVNHKSGNLEWEFRDNKPREVKYLGYPANYGFIPQTILDKADGGDGDPLDILVLGSSVKRGTIQEVKILGAIKLLDSGEQDDKIIAINIDGVFKDIDNLGDMMVKFPGVVEIVRAWFEGYKGSKMHFMGYMNNIDAKNIIEKAHKSWSNHKNEN